MQVRIVTTFHRFAGDGDAEQRQDFPAGLTVEASDEDAADWIAKGLAVPVAPVPPPRHDETAPE